MQTTGAHGGVLAERIEPWLVVEGWRRGGATTAIVLLLMFATAVVYETGGIKYDFSHMMYLPIILAGVLFRTGGGILTAVAAGLLLGPYMPLVVATGEMQSAFNWLHRMLGFVTVGALVGFAVALLRGQLDRMRWLARHDAVTGLPNDVALQQRMGDAIRESGEAVSFSLIAINLDGLDKMRDTFGCVAFSYLLCQIRDALRAALPQDMPLFHYHPERFAVLAAAGESLQHHIQAMVEGLRWPFNYDGLTIHLAPRVGVAHFPEHGRAPVELIQKADMAIWQARQQGMAQLHYRRDFDVASRENLMLMGMLAKALEQEQLCLHYQPKVDLQSRQTVGAEALLRWHHPERGMIPPGMFIPLCEQTDLINPVTAWVMEAAVARLSAWRAEALQPQLAVNISTRNLQDPVFYRQVRQLVDQHGIAPELLELEITETAIMQNPQEAIALLGQLRDMRLTLSIDDFGTGYSSLSYLHRLPVGAIKIDQAFVRHTARDAGVRNIIRAAADVGHALGLTVIAEGVEDAESLEIVAELGCDIGQGYHICRPVPEASLLEWFRSSPWPLTPAPMQP